MLLLSLGVLMMHQNPLLAQVVMLAQEEARRLGHNFVGTEQLLLGLIGESTGAHIVLGFNCLGWVADSFLKSLASICAFSDGDGFW